MDLSHWIWLATAAYAIHVLEEFSLDWRNWARAVIGLPVEWSDFYIVNALVIVLGVVAANLADVWVGVALAFPGLMLVNAIFFHILPMIRTRGRFSPGTITAVILFLPIGVTCYRVAVGSGRLDLWSLIGSVLLAAALMATPIVLLNIKGWPYFRQDRL
ncbi:HXXEE domain-containing protein [Oryzicola mucosus]|uniref:HXXEE domain-containing protein n=1 Tax=Oryzicola mucosus TaxID=2767425 RepID=A0A8J6TZU3_9HYPH|nr:HXXEE domain-containing protein [Oryzicola mucosus]MBD0414791.1 HXXEE domain-containing protein [Oryzicola mucosus]